MATLNSIIADIQSEIGDISGNTFSTSELAVIVNRGIDAVADVYPKEIMSVVGTVAASTYTYSVSSFSNIYRLDVHDSADVYRTELPHAFEGRDSGWEVHAGILYLPPGWPLTAGDTLRAFGYSRYIQLSTGTATTDMDTTAINAVRAFVVAKAYNRLLMDKALFAQYQADPDNSNTTALALNQLAYSSKQDWAAERQRLRKMRKL